LHWEGALAHAHPVPGLSMNRSAVASACSVDERLLKPAAAKSGIVQTVPDGWASAHQLPDALGAMVFDHHQHDALIEPKVPRGNPCRSVGAGKARIETARKATIAQDLRIARDHAAHGVQ